MIIKTLQWNIGGGKIRKPEDRLENSATYIHNGLPHIIELIKSLSPDIVSFQELNIGPSGNQADQISAATGLPNIIWDLYAPSHIVLGDNTALTIMSRFPINKKDFHLFTNPKIERVRPDGTRWTSFDKGVLSADIILGNRTLSFKTLHVFPFFVFQRDYRDPEFKGLISEISRDTKPDSELYLAQGDFNIQEASLQETLPEVFEAGAEEVAINEPTYHEGLILDHVLYKGLKLNSVRVVKEALTDHFPIYSEFALP